MNTFTRRRKRVDIPKTKIKVKDFSKHKAVKIDNRTYVLKKTA